MKTKAKPMSGDMQFTRTEFQDWLTVRELKAWLANVPDIASDGEPAEVWIETDDGKSSPVTLLSPLRSGGSGHVILGRRTQ